MQSLRAKWLAVFCTLAVGASSGFGQITVDEYGNYSGGVLQSFLGPDPTGSGMSSVLQFQLPHTVVAGDIDIQHSDGNSFSDVIRFFNQGGQGMMIFYSVFDDTNSLPADTGTPINNSPFMTINEVGSEVSSSADYLAGVGMPGYDGTVGGTAYKFISDGMVPEPSAGAILALGCGCVCAWRRAKSTRAPRR